MAIGSVIDGNILSINSIKATFSDFISAILINYYEELRIRLLLIC